MRVHITTLSSYFNSSPLVISLSSSPSCLTVQQLQSDLLLSSPDRFVGLAPLERCVLSPPLAPPSLLPGDAWLPLPLWRGCALGSSGPSGTSCKDSSSSSSQSIYFHTSTSLTAKSLTVSNSRHQRARTLVFYLRVISVVNYTALLFIFYLDFFLTYIC